MDKPKFSKMKIYGLWFQQFIIQKVQKIKITL